MTIQELQQEYAKIADWLNAHWRIASADQRIFTRTMKIVEELGELADEILSSMNLQRSSKVSEFSHTKVEDEFADVMGSLVLLAQELNIDIESVMQRKIRDTRKRLQSENQNIPLAD